MNDTKINKKKKLDYLIEDFGKRLKEGIFARQTTSEKDNKAQIRILTRAFQNGAFHDYRLLQNNIGNKETKFGTKYSYLTTGMTPKLPVNFSSILFLVLIIVLMTFLFIFFLF